MFLDWMIDVGNVEGFDGEHSEYDSGSDRTSWILFRRYCQCSCDTGQTEERPDTQSQSDGYQGVSNAVVTETLLYMTSLANFVPFQSLTTAYDNL